MPILLILISVCLSAFAQTLFRIGMTRPDVQAALAPSADGMGTLRVLLLSPYLWSGLAAYGFGTLLWLFVLSKVPVSFAYPFVALGIVITTLSGVFILGEQISRLSMIGIAITALGIVTVAMGRTG
ncbi:GRP family sugar transporter [Gellertiella hungarica]|uniref:Drug/metabolite transporter (DMT)-like permease n=1 Tax=Gellertiella hungarica TaxID=1572859 RepID=A0A7W6NLY1_9HYPH|nr:GRP family sugar transporter [Gellertiella hungarica]MBB4066398.1 drug/metabolite transporter (DMT)-like permease [Gellertiella hungarica]